MKRFRRKGNGIRCTIAVPIEYDRGENDDGKPHAVRWARREIKSMSDMDWTHWHYTSDADWTACGTMIRVGLDGTALPETANVSQVDCKRCRRAMADAEEYVKTYVPVDEHRWEDEGGAVVAPVKAESAVEWIEKNFPDGKVSDADRCRHEWVQRRMNRCMIEECRKCGEVKGAVR